MLTLNVDVYVYAQRSCRGLTFLFSLNLKWCVNLETYYFGICELTRVLKLRKSESSLSVTSVDVTDFLKLLYAVFWRFQFYPRKNISPAIDLFFIFSFYIREYFIFSYVSSKFIVEDTHFNLEFFFSVVHSWWNFWY